MTKKEHDELVKMAEKAARATFNAQPFEVRKKLANPLDRLTEINLLLSKGDSLNMRFIKERKRNLEEWLLDCPLDRLTEINLLLSKGDSLNMRFIKERKRNLEEWLLDWYKEQKGE